MPVGNSSAGLRGYLTQSGVVCLIFLLAVLAWQGCGTKGNDGGKPGAVAGGTTAFPPYDSTRLIVDTYRVDLNGDGRKEYIFTSRDSQGPADPLTPKLFDRVEIFSGDTLVANRKSLFKDPVESGMEIEFEDITGDRRADIVAYTSAGGNDPIASEGMNVYGFRKDGACAVFFSSQSGSPEIQDIDGNGSLEIVLSDEYWGLLDHVDAIGYTAAIFSFDGKGFVESNLEHASYFDRIIGRKKADYLRVRAARNRDAGEQALALYRACADWFVWIAAKGDFKKLQTLWNGERTALQLKLPADLFEDLAALVEESVSGPEQRNSQTTFL
jgi:hypothetical protein